MLCLASALWQRRSKLAGVTTFHAILIFAVVQLDDRCVATISSTLSREKSGGDLKSGADALLAR